MPTKIEARSRRARKTRAAIRQLGAYRLSVHRTCQHIYAQVFDASGHVLAQASSLEPEIRTAVKDEKGKIPLATWVGKKVAERALAHDIRKVAYDRSGFKFHGRIKALADGAREAGLEF